MREKTVLLLAYHLKELKLGKILRQCPAVACQDNRLTQRQFRDARFPLVRTLEQFHCNSTPEPDKRVIREPAKGQSIREHRHVIFVGKTETGKTHMTMCLGIEACRQGIRSRFVTGSELIGELGCVSFSKEDSPLVSQVLADCYERESVIAFNLDFADWTQPLGDPTLTTLLLKDLTHKVRIINGVWKNHRLKESLNRKSMFIEGAEALVSPWQDDHHNFNSPRGRMFSVAIIKLT